MSVPVLHVNQNGLNLIEYLGTAFGHYPVISNKVKVMYKIIHRCYPVNATISRYIHTVCDKCTFCNTSLEDIEHLFLYCPFSISFWTDFKIDMTNKFVLI